MLIMTTLRFRRCPFSSKIGSPSMNSPMGHQTRSARTGPLTHITRESCCISLIWPLLAPAARPILAKLPNIARTINPYVHSNMAAIYSNGGNRWNILGFNFTKRDALSSVYIRYLCSASTSKYVDNGGCI